MCSAGGVIITTGYVTPPATARDSSNVANRIHPAIPTRNTFGSLAMAGYPEDQEDSEAEDEVRDVDTEEVMEDADSGLPDLPDRDENGRLAVSYTHLTLPTKRIV